MRIDRFYVHSSSRRHLLTRCALPLSGYLSLMGKNAFYTGKLLEMLLAASYLTLNALT